MTTTKSIKSEFMTAIVNISDRLLSEVGYNEQKETQLRQLGFIKSDFIADAVDYREYHELAVAYDDKYRNYIFLTERTFLLMKRQLNVYHYQISECKTNIPDQTLDELLNIEIEMGVIDQKTKEINDSDFNTWYEDMNKITNQMYNDIILGGRGKSIFQAGWMESTDFNAVRPVTMPRPLVRLSVDTLKPTLYPTLTTGIDTISEKKKKHLDRMPLTLAEIRKDYPSALMYLRDNVADKPGETTNHLIAIKVEGGYFILTHWES